MNDDDKVTAGSRKEPLSPTEDPPSAKKPGDIIISDLTIPSLKKDHESCIRQIVGGAGCFKEFAITFDGTPSLAEAEAIIVRTVRSRTVSSDEQ